MWRVLLGIATLTGCGRLGFAELGVAGDGGPGDGDAAAASCLPSYQLCEGFEDTTLAPIWMTTSGVTIDPTKAHRGAASIHMHSDGAAVGADSYADLFQTATLPASSSVFHVRAYVWLSHLPLNNMELIAVMQANSANEDAVFVLPDALSVYAQFNDVSQNNETPATVGAWFCVLWTVTLATTKTGSLALAGDPPPVTLANEQTEGTPPVSEMDFGIGFAGSSVFVPEPAMDVWFDDLIVATTPLTCAD